VDYTIGELTKYDNMGHSTVHSLSSFAPPLPPPTLGSIDVAVKWMCSSSDYYGISLKQSLKMKSHCLYVYNLCHRPTSGICHSEIFHGLRPMDLVAL
jgi:hypothetical protein